MNEKLTAIHAQFSDVHKQISDLHKQIAIQTKWILAAILGAAIIYPIANKVIARLLA
jgi:hypothetical protein